MADLLVRKRNGGQTQPSSPASSRELAPMGRFSDLLNWDPFVEMAPMFREEARAAGFFPEFEVKETKDAYLFTADVPGVKESDIEITMTGSRLMIQGKRQEESEEETETYYACERSYGSFSRSFTLPEGAEIDKVHADLKSGVLSLVVPKRPEVQSKRIAVKSAEKGPKA
jgi:HSP20 family protein